MSHKKKIINYRQFLFVLFYFGFVVCMELFLFQWEKTAILSQKSKDLFSLMAVGGFFWVLNGLHWFQNKDLLQKLRSIGWIIILLWGASEVLNGFHDISNVSLNLMIFTHHLLIGLLTWIILILSILLFLAFKELIYIQQTRHTAMQFRFLFLIILIHLIIQIFRGNPDTVPLIHLFKWNGSSVDIFFLILFILTSILNGFRCQWIHYLNKGQKIAVFFSQIFVFVFLLLTFSKLPKIFLQENLMISMFLGYLGSFMKIYFLMVFLTVLIHLPSAGLVDRRMKELRSLQHLSSMLNSVFEKRELAEKITELALNVVGADYSWLEFKNQSNYELVSVNGIEPWDINEIPIELRDLIRQEISIREEPLLVNDFYRYVRVHKFKSWNRKIGSLLGSRIRFQDEDLGILYTVKVDRFGFMEDNQSLFQAFADQVGVSIQNVHLIELTIEQERYREELRLAHEAQMRLLPQRLPEISGFALDGFCITANEIGGDFYDIIEVNCDRIDLVIGDVSGKGASAAFYMAELKGMIQSLAPLFVSPKDILIEMNKYLFQHFESETFVTMIYAILMPKKKQIRFARAGHPPLGLMRTGNVQWIEPKGLGLGLSESDWFKKQLNEKMLHLKKGDLFFFYTDGLVEARNRDDVEFGEDSLTELLHRFGNLEACDFSLKIQETMEEYTKNVSRHDDMTALILQYQQS